MKTLEDAVAATAATAADCLTKITKIEAQIAAEKHASMIARKVVEQHIFASSLGQAHAIAIVEKAKARQSDADQRVADLSNQRWPAARLELEAAERAAERARRALAKPHVDALKRQRVKAAARMDSAFAEAASAYSDFERLGLELLSYDRGDSGMTSRSEAYVGLRRIFAALPECIKSLPAHSTKFLPLAESERQFFGSAAGATGE
jgi:hypothetical protein